MAIGANLTQREQSLIAVAVLALLGLAGYWYFVHSPKVEELHAVEAHVDSLDVANRRARNDMVKGNADSLEMEADRFGGELDALRQLVPAVQELPGLLEGISTSARRVGLDLAGIEPLPVLIGEQFDTYRYKITVL